MEKMYELNASGEAKSIIDSQLDREVQPYLHFEEAYDRIPSSVGLAEGEYRKILR